MTVLPESDSAGSFFFLNESFFSKFLSEQIVIFFLNQVLPYE